jgi:DNA-directed RNA polymerase specialized sigma24 family protein
MNPNRNRPDAPSTSSVAALRTIDLPDGRTSDPATARPPGATTGVEPPAPGNDNATRGWARDTTALLAHPDLVRSVACLLRRHRVAPEDMADAIAEVQLESLETARRREMPGSLAQWKALAKTIATHWALDRLRRARRRGKYDAGLSDDADAFPRPTLHWEHADPVDTKRYLAVLKELFDTGQMPEHGAEILLGEADGVPHAEIAAEIGVSENTVDCRLFRMRRKFRARLAALGMLGLVLLVLSALMAPSRKVAAPYMETSPAKTPSTVNSVPLWDGGPPSQNRPRP